MIGPDWHFSLVLALIVNVCTIGVIAGAIHFRQIALVTPGAVLLLTKNITFGSTVLMNPGLPPRNPYVHSSSYRNRVKTVE